MSIRQIEKGFTLLEVMIAGVILFSSVVLVSLVYRGSLISAEKAINKMELSAVIPSIITLVTDEITGITNYELGQVITSEGEQLGIPFKYSATVVQVSPPPPKFDPDSGLILDYPPKAVLLEVELSVGRRSPLLYKYKEIAWQ